jgi:hypothetical protein
MTVSQLDQLQKIARKLTVAALAVGGRGTDESHQAAVLIGLVFDLHALEDAA